MFAWRTPLDVARKNQTTRRTRARWEAHRTKKNDYYILDSCSPRPRNVAATLSCLPGAPPWMLQEETKTKKSTTGSAPEEKQTTIATTAVPLNLTP